MKKHLFFAVIASLAITVTMFCKEDSIFSRTNIKGSTASAAENDIPLDKEHFPGESLRRYLSNSYDENSDGVLSQEEIGNITKIAMEWTREDDIYLDITGIKALKNIQMVRLVSWYSVIGEKELEQLPKLKKLIFRGVGCELIQPHINSLEMLEVNDDWRKDLDVRYLPNLKILKLGDEGNYFPKSLIDGGKFDKRKTVRKNIDVSANAKLEVLECAGLGLKKLDVSANKKLRRLVCCNNQLKSLDVSANKKLKILNCSNNYIKKLDTGKLKNLKELSCMKNLLGTLNVKGNQVLQTLAAHENKLKKLDVSSCRKLEKLVCGNNRLADLDLKRNLKIVHLGCNNNMLQTLDVSMLNKLIFLGCDHNQLKKLNLARNPKLELLWCNHNKLTSLDVSNNSVLFDLQCNDNKILRLDLRKNKKLAILSINNNGMKYIYLEPTLLDSIERYTIWLNVKGNRLRTIDMRSIATFNDIDEDMIKYWITGGEQPKYAKKITVKTLVASKKLSKSERRFIQKLGKKYKLTVKFV